VRARRRTSFFISPFGPLHSAISSWSLMSFLEEVPSRRGWSMARLGDPAGGRPLPPA